MLWWWSLEAVNVSIEPATSSAGTHTLPAQSAIAPTPTDKTQTLPAVATVAETDANLQRTQSARYPPEKHPESKSPLNHWYWLVMSKEILAR